MLFAVIFEDNPAMSDIRKKDLDAHINWLGQHSEQVLVGGSLRHEPDATPVGGMWIVNAASKEAVQGLIMSDPFWKNGLRVKVDVLHWSKAFEDRKVLV